MVISYIVFCLRAATRPCKYFQLNIPFFDRQAGIFSKLVIDRLIPPPWRLTQFCDDGARQPESYPVFVKPEWSQNARGIHRADNADELRRIRGEIRGAGVRYLIQQGATETNEYEIFSIRHHRNARRWAVLTVTQVCNASEANPINSIHNENTRYVEITDSFHREELDRIWEMVCRIAPFSLSRVSVRADNAADLLRGNFHIIEINLFLPMPINLLDKRHSRRHVFTLAITYMRHLALVTKHRDKSVPPASVFWRSVLYNRRGRLPALLRERLSSLSK